jgi:hypothetical protein
MLSPLRVRRSAFSVRRRSLEDSGIAAGTHTCRRGVGGGASETRATLAVSRAEANVFIRALSSTNPNGLSDPILLN